MSTSTRVRPSLVDAVACGARARRGSGVHCPTVPTGCHPRCRGACAPTHPVRSCKGSAHPRRRHCAGHTSAAPVPPDRDLGLLLRNEREVIPKRVRLTDGEHGIPGRTNEELGATERGNETKNEEPRTEYGTERNGPRTRRARSLIVVFFVLPASFPHSFRVFRSLFRVPFFVLRSALCSVFRS